MLDTFTLESKNGSIIETDFASARMRLTKSSGIDLAEPWYWLTGDMGQPHLEASAPAPKSGKNLTGNAILVALSNIMESVSAIDGTPTVGDWWDLIGGGKSITLVVGDVRVAVYPARIRSLVQWVRWDSKTRPTLMLSSLNAIYVESADNGRKAILVGCRPSSEYPVITIPSKS